MTLGNALRRVLLSSLQGAAITTMHIDGVLHEFSSIPGVREDVTDIVLNIKEIALAHACRGRQAHGAEERRPRRGQGRRYRGAAPTSRFSIPTTCICTLDQGASIRMEFTTTTGKGYVPAERNRPDDAPIGLIPVDASTARCKKVSYKVENTREGQILDYDKLTMDVETDGSVTPEDTVALAARILQDQLPVFINFEEPKKATDERQARARVQRRAAQEGRRARALGALGQLPEERQHRLYRRPHPEDRGRDAAHAELRPQVAERDQGGAGQMGLHLGMEVPDWPPDNIEELAKRFEDQY